MSFSTLSPAYQIKENKHPALNLKEELVERYNLVLKKYDTAHDALLDLGSVLTMDSHCRVPYDYEVMQAIFDSWLRQTIKAAEKAGRGKSSATIERKDLSDKLTDIGDYVRSVMGTHGDLRAEADRLCKEYDYFALVDELEVLSNGLEDRGFVEAANRIAKNLGLVMGYGRELGPKRTKARWLFTRSVYGDSFGYSWNVQKDLSQLATDLATAEENAGVSGASQPVREMVEAITQSRDQLPSRTTFLKGSDGELVVYKEKVQLRLSPDLADGLMAFIATYSSETLVDLEDVGK